MQNPESTPLTPDEEEAISNFRIEPLNRNNESAANELLSPTEKARKAKRMRVTSNPTFRPVSHVRPTSNIVERLFSQAKYIMSDHRKHMDPDHLNELIILKFHKASWNAATIQKCLDENRTVDDPNNQTT